MEKIFYLAQVFGTLNTIGRIILCISMAVFFVTAALSADFSIENNKEGLKRAKAVCKVAFIFLALSLSLASFVPSKETYLLMVGGKVVDSVIEQNPSVKDLPGNTLQLLNEYIVSKTEGIRNKE